MRNLNTQILSYQFLQFNVSRNKLVPQHEKLLDHQVKDLQKSLRLQTLRQLPFIFISDPQCKYHGFRLGDVIRITRTSTQSISYRLVVENDELNDGDYDAMITPSYNSIFIKPKLKKSQITITLTAGDVAENHVGMQQIGKMVEEGQGFNLTDFKNIIEKCKEKNIKTELINLNNLIDGIKIKKNNQQLQSSPAYVLILRNGLEKLMKPITKKEMFSELNSLQWDTKKYEARVKDIQNKKARHNLCFDEKAQEADLLNKKGTIIAYKDVPITKNILDAISKLIGKKGKNLVVEGNKYYDIQDTGIGYHGDAERRKVVAWRLGENMSLHYQWFIRSMPIGKNIKFTVNGGDIYLMSETAVGTNWLKTSTVPTLRHAAGSDGYTITKIKSMINKDGSLKKPKKSDKNYKLVEKLYTVKTENNKDEKPNDKKPSNDKKKRKKPECTPEKIKKCKEQGKICNPKSGRCKKPPKK